MFLIIVAIGAGVAYYFDPGIINNFLGTNSAEFDVPSGADSPLVDSASSSLPALDAQTDDNATVIVSSSAKKSAPKKNYSAATTVSVSQSEASEHQATDSSTSQKDIDVASDDISLSAAEQAATATCLFPPTVPSSTHKVIFNEIAWMGTPSSSTAEWMEIKNVSANTIDVSGWKLMDTSGKLVMQFLAGDTIASGGLRVLVRGSASTSMTSVTNAEIYSGDLVNTGDVLALVDSQCNVSDYLDASHGWPDGNNTTKQTMERDADGIGWHMSALPGGTPGAENSIKPVSVQPQPQSQVSPQQTQTAPLSTVSASTTNTTAQDAETSTITPTSSLDAQGEIIVDNTSTTPDAATTTSTSSTNHILIAAVQIGGASSTNDLVTLYNPTPAAVDVSGWKLHKKSGTGTDYSLKVFPAGSAIAPGQSFTWANSTGGFSEAVGANVSSTETLSADNSVALMDPTGNIIDAVAWGIGTGQFTEGAPYPTNPGANQLLSRRSLSGVMIDTDNNTNDFTLQ